MDPDLCADLLGAAGGMSVRARAWTALLLPQIAWFGFEQGLSALLHADCTRTGWGVAMGVAALLLCGLAGRMARRFAGRGDVLADVWLARLALAVSGIFALAIIFQILAVLLVPACVG
jgi:hypothetical protein